MKTPVIDKETFAPSSPCEWRPLSNSVEPALGAAKGSASPACRPPRPSRRVPAPGALPSRSVAGGGSSHYTSSPPHSSNLRKARGECVSAPRWKSWLYFEIHQLCMNLFLFFFSLCVLFLEGGKPKKNQNTRRGFIANKRC